MTNALIEVEGLRKRFRTRRGPVEAVAGIDFAVQAGEFVGYAGPNGAGKSTTVKMMSGILLPSSGRLEVLDWGGVGRPIVSDRFVGRFMHETALLFRRNAARQR